MNRAQSLLYLKPRFDQLMLGAGLGCADDPNGYGPTLDASFTQYIHLNALNTNVMQTEVEPEDETGFTALLRAIEYDLLLPHYALTPDMSVDAPLTNVKFSQTFRALKQLRDDAWAEANNAGYIGGTPANVGGFVLDLAHNSPSDPLEFREFREFG